MKRRTEQIHIKASPSEKEALRETARRRGISLSELMRESALREAGRELARAIENEGSQDG